MSSFTENLVVENISPRLWRTYREFTYYIGSLDSSEYVVVPRGFKTDFASIPRIFWILLPPDGVYTQAAVLHDYLYDKKIYSRKKSDQIFLEAMKVLKVNRVIRHTMYMAVRSFGWYAWNKK